MIDELNDNLGFHISNDLFIVKEEIKECAVTFVSNHISVTLFISAILILTTIFYDNFVKLYSTNILYNTVDEPIGYIVMTQIIFLVARIFLLIISYFIGDIKIMLYMFIFIIFLISLKKDTIGVSS